MAGEKAPIEVDINEADELAGIAEAELEGRSKLDPAEHKPAKARDTGEQDGGPSRERDEAGKFKGKEQSEAKAEGADGKAPTRTVPHQALHEERESRKAIARELAQERQQNAERMARLEERLRMISEGGGQRQAQQNQRPAPPDPKKDIFGAFEYVNKEVQTLRQQQENERQQAQRSAQDRQTQDTQERQVMSHYSTSARRFQAAQPDFPQAYQYAIQSRAQELAALGHDPSAVQAQLREDERSIAYSAFQSGNDPAEMLYNWATSRGYRTAPPQQQNGGQQGGQGQQNGKANGNGAEHIERLSKAQDASESLSKAGGQASSSGKISLEALDRMTDAEFKAFTGKLAKNGGMASIDALYKRLEGGSR